MTDHQDISHGWIFCALGTLNDPTIDGEVHMVNKAKKRLKKIAADQKIGRREAANILAAHRTTRQHRFILAEDRIQRCTHMGCHSTKDGHGVDERCPVQDRSYTDLWAMLTDISAHTQATGDIILSGDNPQRVPSTIGFWALPAIGHGIVQANCGWSISVRDLKRCLDEAEPTKAQIVREALKTRSGKMALAASFKGQRQAV